MSVVRQVSPKSATFNQGNFCRGATSKGISADGLNVLSMKHLPLQLQGLQILSGFESHGLTWRDIYFRTGAGVPTNASLARLYREDPEASQLNPVVGLEGILHAVEDGVYRLFRFRLADTRPLDDLIDKIEFDHWSLRLTVLYLLSLLQTYSYHPLGTLSNVN